MGTRHAGKGRLASSSQEGAIERQLGVEDFWGEEVDAGQGFGVAVIFSGQTWS